MSNTLGDLGLVAGMLLAAGAGVYIIANGTSEQPVPDYVHSQLMEVGAEIEPWLVANPSEAEKLYTEELTYGELREELLMKKSDRQDLSSSPVWFRMANDEYFEICIKGENIKKKEVFYGYSSLKNDTWVGKHCQ